MSVNTIHDVEFGAELPVFEPDTRIENTMAFAKSVGWGGPALKIMRVRARRDFQAHWCQELWAWDFDQRNS